jgi:apolipoprotein N-acyltransferase
MQFLAARIAALRGWRRWAVAAGFGATATLAMPPVSLTPMLLVAFPGFVWLLDGATWRGAARDGWWFGFGFLVTGLYWIANALLTDPAQYGWLLPFAVLGLPAALALFVAGGAVVARTLWVPGPLRVVAVAVGWSAAEAARGHWFTGFPWNLVGTTWTWSDVMLQGASVVGAYGLGFLTVLVAATPAVLAEPGRPRRPQAFWALAVAVATILVAGAWGNARLNDATTDAVPGVMLRLVQADIDQPNKWDAERREDNLRRHLDLTASSGHAAPTVVVWPETAVPFLLDFDPATRMRIAAALPSGALLITGAVRAEQMEDGGLGRLFNSVQVLDASGRILATYDKSHLVPFGEYVPLRPLVGAAGLGAVASGIGDYSAGSGPRTVELPNTPPASLLVCYEVIFPGEVVDAAHRPGWMLNVTNDAWYGFSAGPFQHFATARVRAVEQGLPLVRAANTGISGVIDSWGRVRVSLALGVAGVIDEPLPIAMNPTPYARYGFVIPVTLVSGGVVLLLGVKFAARTRRRLFDLTKALSRQIDGKV